jgi:hypothetical protein
VDSITEREQERVKQGTGILRGGKNQEVVVEVEIPWKHVLLSEW